MRLGGLTPFMLFVRDEMKHKCRELFVRLAATGNMDLSNNGVSIESTIRSYAEAFAPKRWGNAYVEVAKDFAAVAYTVHFTFGGLVHEKRGYPRVKFCVDIAHNAITNEY